MPRKVRVEYPGAMYHIMSRGNIGNLMKWAILFYGLTPSMTPSMYCPYPDPLQSWMQANEDNIGTDWHCFNACAINACANPKYVLHFEGDRDHPVLRPPIPESQWKGQQ